MSLPQNSFHSSTSSLENLHFHYWKEKKQKTATDCQTSIPGLKPHSTSLLLPRLVLIHVFISWVWHHHLFSAPGTAYCQTLPTLPPRASDMHFLLYIWRPPCLVHHQLCCRPQPWPIMSALLPSIYSPLHLVNLPTAAFPPSDGFSLLWGSKADQPMKPCVVHRQHLSSLSTY